MRCNSLKLNISYQAFKSSFCSKEIKLCTFCLLKRKYGILYFKGHMSYDLPMTPRLILLSKSNYGTSKPKFRAKQQDKTRQDKFITLVQKEHA